MNISIRPVSGIGREELEKLVVDQRDVLASAIRDRDEAVRAKREAEATRDAAQAASTRDITIARACRFIGDDEIMRTLAPLGAAILRARAKHPKGCALRHLVSEVGELSDAMAIGDEGIEKDPASVADREKRIREEALDVAVVAMRIAFGEVRP